MISLIMLFLLSMVSVFVCVSVVSYCSTKCKKKKHFPMVMCSIIGWALVVFFTIITA